MMSPGPLDAATAAQVEIWSGQRLRHSPSVTRPGSCACGLLLPCRHRANADAGLARLDSGQAGTDVPSDHGGGVGGEEADT